MMRTDDGRIDHLQRGVGHAASGERFQHHVPDAAVGPPPKLPKDRVPVAEFLRQVAPVRITQKMASSRRRWFRGGRPPRWTRKGAKYAHSSSVISPRIKAALRKEQP